MSPTKDRYRKFHELASKILRVSKKEANQAQDDKKETPKKA